MPRSGRCHVQWYGFPSWPTPPGLCLHLWPRIFHSVVSMFFFLKVGKLCLIYLCRAGTFKGQCCHLEWEWVQALGLFTGLVPRSYSQERPQEAEHLIPPSSPPPNPFPDRATGSTDGRVQPAKCGCSGPMVPPRAFLLPSVRSGAGLLLWVGIVLGEEQKDACCPVFSDTSR